MAGPTLSRSPTITVSSRSGSMWVSAGPRDVVFGQRQDGRHERREVVVGQLVERELRGGAGDLLAGFEVAGIAARQRGAAEQQLLVR